MFALTPLGRGSATLGVPRACGQGGWAFRELKNGQGIDWGRKNDNWLWGVAPPSRRSGWRGAKGASEPREVWTQSVRENL